MFREKKKVAPPVDEDEPLPDVNIFDLIRAFQNVLKRFEESEDLGDIIDDRYTVADKNRVSARERATGW